jgi:serine/threonine protein phosphatase PrpC
LPTHISQHNSIQLHDAHEAIVVASDGVWEVLDSNTVANLVHDWKREGLTASAAAKKLTDAATDQSSPDNISAIVMYLAM